MNQQMKYYETKTGWQLILKSVYVAVLPLVLAVNLILPQPAMAQDCDTVDQGTIDVNNEFTEEASGTDFKITCEDGSDDTITVNTKESLGGDDGNPSYTESQSSVMIDISDVTDETKAIEITSDAEKTILTAGTIANDKEGPGSVVAVDSNLDAETDGVPYDVNFESHATISSENDSVNGLSAGITAANTDKKTRVTVVNSGTIRTEGDNALGLRAYIETTAATSENVEGLISVTNQGTIETEGDGATGLEAVFRHQNYSADTIEIQDSGNVEIVNTGTINASGSATGIYAETYGSGKINIAVRGGTVSAGHPGSGEDAEEEVPKKSGIGIHAKANTDDTLGEGDPPAVAVDRNDSDKDVDVVIVVSGSGTTILAHGSASTKGVAIQAETGADNGHSMVEIGGGANVSAYSGDEESNGYAVKFVGGKGTLDIDGASLVGNIMFTDKNDVLTIGDSGSTIDGNIDFDDGDDEMTINMGEITGTISGLTKLTKKSTGAARFGGDVTFDGSSVLNLEEGALIIAGKMDLGSGEVTIHEAGRIVFEIGKNGTTGSITAGSMHFEEIDAEDVAVYAQLNDDLTDEEVTTARTGLTAGSPKLLMVKTITSGTDETPVDSLTINSVQYGGDTVQVGSIEHADGVGTASFDEDTVNQIAKLNPDKPAPVSTGGDDDNNDVLLGLGLVAVLIALYWGDGLFGGSSFADEYAFNTPQSAYYASIDDRNILTIRESGNQPYQVWIRTGHNDTMNLAGISSSGVSGTEIGLSLYRTDDFYIEASSAQNVTAQVNALNQQAQGEVYSLSSGWRNERYFAGVKLSHGDYDFNLIIHNPVVNSALLSDSEVTHTQAQFTAGTRLSTGGLEFIPSASIQAGSFDYAAHEAQGAALSAEVPAYTQDYSALRVGLKMSAGEWLNLSDDTKWKPHLQLDQIRTDSERNGDVSLRQRDKIGALSFNSGAVVQAMPEVVSALSFGASVKSSKSNRGEWRFGYAGLEAEGEYYHAAVAAYQMRF